MGKKRLEDLLSTFWDNGIQDFLESGAYKEVAKELGEQLVEEGTAMAIADALVAIMPRFNSLRLTYKEKRFERNIKKAISVINSKIDELDSKYNALSEELQEKFRGIYVEWILDIINAEKQVEKVPYLISGYINMMEDNTTDDMMLIFLETLNQLTVLDIDVLKIYSREYEEDWYSVCEKRGITHDQLNMVKAKLERHGLLKSNNTEKRNENLDCIVEYLSKVNKAIKSNNGSFEKVKLGTINKISKSELYTITRLGRDFLKKIG